MKRFFSGIKSEVETINSGEKIYYEKSYAKIGVNTDDHIYICECCELPGISGKLVVKSKLPPQSGPSLEAVEPHP